MTVKQLPLRCLSHLHIFRLPLAPSSMTRRGLPLLRPNDQFSFTRLNSLFCHVKSFSLHTLKKYIEADDMRLQNMTYGKLRVETKTTTKTLCSFFHSTFPDSKKRGLFLKSCLSKKESERRTPVLHVCFFV